MVAHADALGLLTLMPVVVWEVPQPGERGVEHGHVDELTDARVLALIQRDDDSQRGVDAGGDIGDGETHLRGCVRIAVGRKNPRFALNEKVVRLHVAIWTIGAVPR